MITSKTGAIIDGKKVNVRSFSTHWTLGQRSWEKFVCIHHWFFLKYQRMVLILLFSCNMDYIGISLSIGRGSVWVALRRLWSCLYPNLWHSWYQHRSQSSGSCWCRLQSGQPAIWDPMLMRRGSFQSVSIVWRTHICNTPKILSLEVIFVLDWFLTDGEVSWRSMALPRLYGAKIRRRVNSLLV